MEEEYNEDEYGRCPNCGSMVHISDMGQENGTTCCKYCYQELREEKSL